MNSTATRSIRLFSADLDGTLLGDRGASLRFKAAWATLLQGHRPLLVYNSGRFVEDVRDIVAQGLLPGADLYIGGVGTQVFDVANGRMLDEWEARLTKGWNLRRVRDVVSRVPGVRAQPQECQHPFKSSWYLDEAKPGIIRQLCHALAAAALRVRIVYSSARDLDILPHHAAKGGALTWLCNRLRIPLDRVLVAGDTGNDISMFRLAGVRSIIVANALPELLEATVDRASYRSHSSLADGVLAGLHHYGVLSGPHGSESVNDPTVTELRLLGFEDSGAAATPPSTIKSPLV